MIKLHTELFVARRIGAKGPMVRIAVATTAVSIAVMIVAVAVIMGFRSEISGKISAFSGHLRVQALDYSGSPESAPIRLDPGLEGNVALLDGFRSMAPYALKTGLVRTDEATQGVVLKGVGGGYDLSFFEACLREGALPRISGLGSDSVRHKDILISETLARLLRLSVDDRVEMLFAGGSAGRSAGLSARRDRFRVSGLYSSGFGEMDGRIVLTDIANVQRLGSWDADQVTGYEIVIDDMERLGEFGRQVAGLVEARSSVRVAGGVIVHDADRPALMVRSVQDDFPQLFDWLKTHDVNAAVIITIMIAVALISMISALLIILLERIRMIGVLKTLGMRNGPLRRIFVIRAARILLLGLLIGDVLGIGLAFLQQHTGLVKLDQSGYFLSAVPIELGWWWIVALNVGTFAVILALLVFPTSIVSRITPEKTIRYQ